MTPPSPSIRSEEHTSELQSHSDLHSFPTRRSSDLINGIGLRDPIVQPLRVFLSANPRQVRADDAAFAVDHVAVRAVAANDQRGDPRLLMDRRYRHTCPHLLHVARN